MVLVVDLQVGLYQLARDWDPTLYYNNMVAHAAVAKLFDLPVVMTTSAQTGELSISLWRLAVLMSLHQVRTAHCPFRSWTCIRMPRWSSARVKSMLGITPNSALPFRRPGRNKLSWLASPLMFVSRAAGLERFVTHGKLIDRRPGTTFLALSLRAEGYSVWANAEASGTTTTLIRDISNTRMQAAGVQIVSLFSIVCDLMRDWRNTPGALEVLPWLNQYYPVYGFVARAHAAAITNGSLIAGEAPLIMV